MQILKLNSFPIEQIPNMHALELDLAAWFVARDYPVRLLAYSQAFQMQHAIAHIQQAQAGMERIGQAVAPLLRAIDAFLGDDPTADPTEALREVPPHILALLLETFAPSPMIQQLLTGEELIGVDDDRTRWAMLGDAFDLILWRLPWTKEAIRFYQAME